MYSLDYACCRALRWRRFRGMAGAAVAFTLLFPCGFAVAKPLPTKAGYAWYQQWAWTAEAWTGSSAPYQKIKDNITHLITAGQQPAVLLNKYQVEAQQHSNDPQRQFAWAYITYLIATARQTPYVTGFNVTQGPLQALAEVPSPHAYVFDRLRFLMEASLSSYRQLMPVGRRLLQRDPNDAEVRKKYVYLLAASDDPAEQQQALAYAQQLVKADPSNPTAYMIPASLYMTRWLHNHHDKEDAEKASAAYQQWLQHAPSDDAYRETAQFTIRMLQKG